MQPWSQPRLHTFFYNPPPHNRSQSNCLWQTPQPQNTREIRQTPIFFGRTSNNRPIVAPVTLVVGNKLRVRIEGEKNKKNPARGDHYMLKPLEALPPHTLEIRHNAKNTQLEQTIEIEVYKEIDTEINLRACYSVGDMEGILVEGVHPIKIRIISRISLPDENTDAGLLTRLLLAEALSPMFKSRYSDGKDSIRSMELMREVLDNRITVIRNDGDLAKYAGFGSTDTIRGVIYPNVRSGQFFGFINNCSAFPSRYLTGWVLHLIIDSTN